jgi:uncharacterized protein (DUF983 family)
MKIECPRCAQGYVFNATIKRSGVRVVVCGECEALWTDVNQVKAANFQDMVSFLESEGIEGAWDALVFEAEEGTG